MHKETLPVICLLVLAGLCLLLYPIWRGHRLQAAAAEAAQLFLAKSDRDNPALYEAMQAYNGGIYAEGQVGLSSPSAYETSAIELADYGIEDGIIGVLEIPAMDLTMPVYLGASAENLGKGAAHMGQTSLPVGGENTNCVIAGHRGWNGADYFRHIDILQPGDSVTLTNLWETLHYEVFDVAIIMPDDVDAIRIQPGHDLLTLLTCHPYASGGRERYVVYCWRLK